MSRYVAVNLRCPELSRNALVTHCIDLDGLDGGRADIYVDRDFFVTMGDIANWPDLLSENQ